MRNVMCYDNETIKWNHDGVNYCVHIQRDDPDYIDVRDFYHESIMACFDSKNKYGDEIEERTAEEFWRNMVWKYCSNEEILNAFSADILFDVRVVKVDDNDYIIYEQSLNKEWEAIYRGLDEDELLAYVKDELSIMDCMILMDHGNHAVWLPLYIHEYSGISMDVETFGNEWDTSCVGWIVTPMCQNHTSADEMRATQVMHEEVRMYSQWLHGEVYYYTLYQRNGNDEEEFYDWIEIDCCGGFIGDDIIKNGIIYNVRNGLEEAIENESYEIGEAKKTVVVKWEF